jgi:prephenate dehydrogenase
MRTNQKTFLIVGLGLMGGSLAAALRKKFPHDRVIGTSRHQKTITLAKRKGLIHQGFVKLEPAVAQADFIFICGPVDIIPELISKVDCYAKPGTIVTHVGSTKRAIVRWAEKQHFKNIRFIGSHPLAGSHETGVSHSDQNLYKGAIVFLTPTPKTCRAALGKLSQIWKKLETKICTLAPEEHDKIVSEISHLPHAVASILVRAVSDSSLPYAASGFLDTTRIAQGDPRLWAPIFQTNRGNLLKHLRLFERTLKQFINLAEINDKRKIKQFLEKSSKKRKGINGS